MRHEDECADECAFAVDLKTVPLIMCFVFMQCVSVLLSSVLILHSSTVHAAVTFVAMDRVRYKSLFVLYSTDPLDSADCDPCTLESVSHGARSFPRQFHRRWF